MRTYDYFLGQNFHWEWHSNELHVHMSQSAFTQTVVDKAHLPESKFNPTLTPYIFGIFIDLIQPFPLPFKHQANLMLQYQCLIGFINWMATCTRPDLEPSVSFLAT